MSFSEVELPSNRKFGFFFSFLLFLFAAYFLYVQSYILASSLSFVALLLLVITVLNDKILLPLNSLWIRFGMFLGMIISPIIMGIIFFDVLIK